MFVLVYFWLQKADQRAGQPPRRVNDFLMQLRPTGVRIVTDKKGWYKSKDGTFIDPATLDPDQSQPEWERETYDRDLPAEIAANIEAYWERAEERDYPAKHTNPVIRHDNSDPHGILARPDVAALRGKEVDRP
ncbi:hypothetical protein LCGC14_1430830 [marine sediment metagenome]|uniref:Uncharacterized protein n=1 Tax=marine sediment metagenome TaxID=412755 RepID=A0A0F9MQC4_9ZZZZ